MCLHEFPGEQLSGFINFAPQNISFSITKNRPQTLNLDYRCLDEGAEEFFLKPMQISDIKKLVSHIKKEKQTEEEHESKQMDGGEVSTVAAVASASPTNHSSSGYKRKASSEGGVVVESSLSPDRTRQRFTVTAGI